MVTNKHSDYAVVLYIITRVNLKFNLYFDI